MPSRYSPYADELTAQEDNGRIKLMWGQIVRRGFGTNKVRARIKDLIEERDRQGISEEDRKKLAEKILTACDQVVQAEEAPRVEDRRAEWLAQGMVTVTRANTPDATGRRWIKTAYPDGYTETVFFETDEEWTEHLANELHGEAQLEDQRRGLQLERVPEDMRGLVRDPNALIEVMRDRDLSVEDRKALLHVLKPAMAPKDYERVSQTLVLGQEVTT